MLTTKYIFFAILGLLSVIGGIETLNILTFEGYTTYWSGLLIIAAAIAAIGSKKEEWESVEKWGAVFSASLLGSWSVAALLRACGIGGEEADFGRAAGAFTVLVITLLPATRAIFLLRRARTRGHR